MTDTPPLAQEIDRLRAENERLREALQYLVDDLRDRAKWMRFEPREDGSVVPCGAGAWDKAIAALTREGTPND